MKILLDSYNECFQNDSGGVRTKIEFLYKCISKSCEVKLFDMWNDKIRDFDIYHVIKPGIQNYFSIKYAKSLGIPIVISAVFQYEGKIKNKIKKISDKFTLLKTSYSIIKEIYMISDAIIAETIVEKNNICNAFNINESKVFVIPNGVSIDFKNDYTNLMKERTGINAGFVLQVGRFDSNKNQLNVIEALKDTDIDIVFIGGPDKDELNYYEKCRKIASNRCHFLGWIKHDDPLLISAYQNCHSFILPSFKEIFGNALFEAASCGANIITTNVLPLDSWKIKDYCYVIEPKNIENIKEKIIESQKHEKNDKLKEIVIDNFSWEKIVTQHINIYKGLLKKC